MEQLALDCHQWRAENCPHVSDGPSLLLRFASTEHVQFVLALDLAESGEIHRSVDLALGEWQNELMRSQSPRSVP